MHRSQRIDLELYMDGELVASENVTTYSLPARIMQLGAFGKHKCKKDWELFKRVPSKCNGWIKLIKLKEKPAREKRSFDIFELKQLRDKGLSWMKIAKQLYSNERTLRTYFKEHQNELSNDTENNI